MHEGRKPSIKHLRVFGSRAMVRISPPLVKGKLKPRSESCVFIGYNSVGPTLSYRFIRDNGAYTTSGNAVFNELPLVFKHSKLGEKRDQQGYHTMITKTFMILQSFTEFEAKDFVIQKRVKFSENSPDELIGPMRTRSRSKTLA
jgi:hypothetical protein